jgi:hypothetical protein
MGMFVYYPLWDQKTAQYCYDGIRKWFKDNPNKNECKTESCTIRRASIKEDILENSEKGVVLQEDPKNKDFKKSLPEDEKPAKKTKKPAKKAAKKTAKKSK